MPNVPSTLLCSPDTWYGMTMSPQGTPLECAAELNGLPTPTMLIHAGTDLINNIRLWDVSANAAPPQIHGTETVLSRRAARGEFSCRISGTVDTGIQDQDLIPGNEVKVILRTKEYNGGNSVHYALLAAGGNGQRFSLYTPGAASNGYGTFSFAFGVWPEGVGEDSVFDAIAPSPNEIIASCWTTIVYSFGPKYGHAACIVNDEPLAAVPTYRKAIGHLASTGPVDNGRVPSTSTLKFQNFQLPNWDQALFCIIPHEVTEQQAVALANNPYKMLLKPKIPDLISSPQNYGYYLPEPRLENADNFISQVKPNGPLELVKEDPLAQGLQVFIDVEAQEDLVKNTPLETVGMELKSTQAGVGRIATTANDYIRTANSIALGSSYTIWAHFQQTGTDTDEYVCGMFNGTNGLGIQPRQNVATTTRYFYYNGVNNGTEILNLHAPGYTIVLVFNNSGDSTLRTYINGQPEGVYFKGSPQAIPTLPFYLGNFYTSTYGYQGGVVLSGGVFTRALSEVEAIRLSKDPYCITVPK